MKARLSKRRQGWYAEMDLPRDVIEIYGKKRLLASLQTRDKHEASMKLPYVTVKWQREIQNARKGVTPSVHEEALHWRNLIDEKLIGVEGLQLVIEHSGDERQFLDGLPVWRHHYKPNP